MMAAGGRSSGRWWGCGSKGSSSHCSGSEQRGGGALLAVVPTSATTTAAGIWGLLHVVWRAGVEVIRSQHNGEWPSMSRPCKIVCVCLGGRKGSQSMWCRSARSQHLGV